MPPLEQTLLSSSNHSVGSGSSIFTKVRTNLALSPTRHTKPCISSKHNIHNNVTTSNVDSELRTARDACIGAMMALLPIPLTTTRPLPAAIIVTTFSKSSSIKEERDLKYGFKCHYLSILVSSRVELSPIESYNL